jgi:hypothetical protein
VRSYQVILAAGFLATAVSQIPAQQTTGEITGTVTDTSGAVIAGAAITITNNATQQNRATTTSNTGSYDVPYLTPGTYTVQSAKQGFKKASAQNVEVAVGSDVRMDFKLQVGQVTEQVEVTTAAPLLATESAAVQNEVEGQQIVALPLNGRDYLQLVALNPNVVQEPTGGTGGITSGLVGLAGTRAQSLISVAGQRLEYNHYTLDGIENTEPNYNTYIIHPSIDALQEFTVLTGIYSAEFGRGASQINATTLPGSNAYHATAYDFLRNDFVDAKPWLQPGAKYPFHREDYGFVFDGPLSIPRIVNGRDKLFFSSSFEALRDSQVVPEFASVPTQDMIAGNFSDGMPGEEPIYWPQSQVFSGANKGACQISSAGSYNVGTGVCTVSGTLNVLPPGTITAQAQKLMSLYPQPNWNNASKTSAPANEETAYGTDYETAGRSLTQETQFNQRVDWTMSPRSDLFGRFSWEDDASSPASAFGAITADITNTTARQVVIGHTFIINQHTINEARAGYDFFYNDNSSPYANGTFNPQASLGINGIQAYGPQDYGYPSIGVTGLTTYGGASPYITHDNIYSYMDSVAIIRGNHTFRIGGMFEADQFNQLGNQFGTGAINFNGQATLNPAKGTTTAASGFALADMELGVVSGEYLRISALSNVEMRTKKYAAFLQDDWKIRRNITLNLGIRYDNIRPWVDKHDNFWNIQVPSIGVNLPTAPWQTEPVATKIAGAPSPIYTRPGSSGCNFYGSASNTASLEFSEPGQPVQCGNQYMGRSTVNPNNENFGPRVGIAWALGEKTSIRAGYGIYYVTDQSEYAFDMGRNLGGKDGTTSVPEGAPYIPLSAPWSLEAANAACGPNQYNGGVNWTGPCVSAPQFNALAQNNRTPYVEQYMFNVERQITKNVAVEFAYQGNESHHNLRDFILNQAVPRSGPTDTSSTLSRRPWSALGNIQMVSDWDRGNYNAMDIKLSQHISHGLLYTVAFTWGHAMDFGSAYRTTGGDNLWPWNSYNQRQEYGNSQFNQARRLVGSFSYNLPFGQGRMIAPGNPVVNHIVSGWVFGGILTLADGTSVNPTNAGDPSQLGSLGTAPQWQGISQYRNSHVGITGGIASTSPYWNPAAFACAYTAVATSYCTTPGYPNQAWQAGNWHRTNLTLPGLEEFDTNIGRTFHIHESHTLLIRIEAFNATNRVNWGAPASTNPSAATFGQITTTTTAMRQLQGAIKYSF